MNLILQNIIQKIVFFILILLFNWFLNQILIFIYIKKYIQPIFCTIFLLIYILFFLYILKLKILLLLKLRIDCSYLVFRFINIFWIQLKFSRVDTRIDSGGSIAYNILLSNHYVIFVFFYTSQNHLHHIMTLMLS